MHIVSAKRTYHLVGSINEDGIRTFSNWYREKASEDSEDWISLLISSGGGWTSGGFALIDLIMSIHKRKLQTVALGLVNSMAIPLFLAGERRICSPRTTFYFHEMSSTFKSDERLTISEMRHYLDGLVTSQKMYAEFVASRTGGQLSAEKVEQMMQGQTYLNAKQALELGLAHEISTEA